MRILIVEDDLIARKILASILAPYGTCDLAENGEEAIEKVRLAMQGNSTYKFICMDIVMPKMDGQLALQEIRNIEKSFNLPPANRARVLFLTSLDAPEAMVDDSDSTIAYVNKPIDGENVIKTLKSFGLSPW